MKPKKCAECGKIFTPKCGTQRYCVGPHVTKCAVCGKEFTYTVRPTEKPQTCGVVCREKLKVIHLQEQYGVTNVSQLQYVRDKISESNSSPEVQHRRACTSLQNWGVDNPAKHPDIRAKMSAKMKTAEYLEGRKQTCLRLYDAESPMQNEEVKRKQRATNRRNHNMDGHPHTREDFMKMMTDPSKVDAYLAFRADPALFIKSNYTQAPIITQLERDLGVTNTPIYNILIAHDCRELLATTYSTMEDDIVNYLLSICPTLIIERNNRSIISPQEIDIYLPEYKLGIECNPVATHNSSFVDPWGSRPKHYKYHQNKSNAASDAGVFLFHVFGYEWNNKQDIIKSMLRNLLHQSSESIGARSCYVAEIDHNTCCKFLMDNHRQGATTALIRLGLYRKDTDELISVMTFSKPRHTMGKSADACEYELTRFCSKLNTNVIGGASKLFKYFIQTYHPESISSFSDIAHTSGHLYETLGFSYASCTGPSYVWVDLYDNIYYHRVVCQKHNLRKLFKDETIDIDNCSERQIMESHKFARVYDCGVVKWIWRISL